MEEIKLHRLKKGMQFHECVVAIAGGIIGNLSWLQEVCEEAESIREKGNEKYGEAMYGILSILDVMEIYGGDLSRLFVDLCKEDKKKFLIIVWVYEVGLNQSQFGDEVPEFAKLETIKQIIAELHSGKEPSFPFDEAEKFIEKNSSVCF